MWFNIKHVKGLTVLLFLTSTVGIVAGRATDDLEEDLQRWDLDDVDFDEVEKLEKRQTQENEETATCECPTEGRRGLRGPRGSNGRDGRDGRDGNPGFNGVNGEMGEPGKAGEPGPVGPVGPPGLKGVSGVTYIRWGRTVCNNISSSELVYQGLAGGTFYTQSGGGVNVLCLPDTPEYNEVAEGTGGERGRVYSAEYQTDTFEPLEALYQHDIPCAVCDVSTRGRYLMIPAIMTCPEGWTHEYDGYLMSARHDHAHPTEFVCVDRDAEPVPNTASNTNGLLLFPVDGRCGSNSGTLPCGPYVSGNELSCVVCTK